jgi:hypothetical protein
MSKLFEWPSRLVLALLAVGLGLALQPTNTLSIFDTASGERRLCVALVPGETIAYVSRNSIYGVPVTEVWQVEDARIRVVEVVSAPTVLDYYGIVDYQVGANGQARGNPGLQYTDLRIRLTDQGQQRLQIWQDMIDLATLVPEGALTITTETAPRWLACR